MSGARNRTQATLYIAFVCMAMLACNACSKWNESVNDRRPCEFTSVQSVTVGKLKSIRVIVPQNSLTRACVDSAIRTFVASDNGFYGLVLRLQEEGFGYPWEGPLQSTMRQTMLQSVGPREKSYFSLAQLFRVDFQDQLTWVRRGRLLINENIAGHGDPHAVHLPRFPHEIRLQSMVVHSAGVGRYMAPGVDWYAQADTLPTQVDMMELADWLISHCGLENAIFDGAVYLRTDSNFQMHGGPSFDLSKPFESADADSLLKHEYWACAIDSGRTGVSTTCKRQFTSDIHGIDAH